MSKDKVYQVIFDANPKNHRLFISVPGITTLTAHDNCWEQIVEQESLIACNSSLL